MTHPFTPRRGRLLGTACAALILTAVVGAPAAAFAVPAAAPADVSDHGGAVRNDGDQTQALRDSIVDGPAKNVILLIGDGMGDSEITVARNYAEGAAGEFAGIDALPLTGQYTTYAVNADGTPNYTSESASTASAWSTGTKTVNGRLSVDVAGAPEPTLLELAKANGKKTGNVSTAEIQDATPGAQISHISARGCYAPAITAANCPEAAVENGGLGSISEQLLNLRPDVTFGGGSKSFDEVALGGQWQGETLFAQAEERGYQLVDDAAELAGVAKADQTQPVLGLFTAGNFPVRWVGPQATVGGGDLAAQACTENPARLDTGLSLASLTSKAIGLLDNEDGFFLQVEGASIDKQDHAADACGQIGETVDLDEAVQVALEFAKTNGDTLVVATADHAHTSQIVGSTPPGLSAHLITGEGQPMIVAYGTAPQGGSQQHTGSQVRIAGYGPGAANVVGLTDQTDLFFTSKNALELNGDLAALSADATLSLSAAQVAPGSEFTATVAGLDADWQASGLLESDPVDLGTHDVIDGALVLTATAPEELGTHTVTITGAQTGVEITAELTVTETPAPGTGGSGEDTGPAAGAAAGTSGSGGALASTGAVVAPFAALAALLLALGASVVWRKRRAAAAQLHGAL
jgi:alkaline phosphatase